VLVRADLDPVDEFVEDLFRDAGVRGVDGLLSCAATAFLRKLDFSL
jgi:hypothetical protein